jgi:hypothetical protein
MRCAGPCSIAERLARNIGVAKAGTSMQPSNLFIHPSAWKGVFCEVRQCGGLGSPIALTSLT